jgi:type III secretion system low calcium response chaperone LcrH/SycD
MEGHYFMDKQKKANHPKVEIKKDGPVTSEIVRQLVKAAVIKLGDKVSKEEKVSIAKALTKVFEQGIPPKEALEIGDNEMSQLYSAAFQMFTSGKFPEAREMFKMLLLFDPHQSGFAVSLGACHHHLKDYQYALEAYLLASKLAPTDPVPLFYAYDCCKALNNPHGAAIMLSNVIAQAGDNKVYAKVKERAKILLEDLEKQLVQPTT